MGWGGGGRGMGCGGGGGGGGRGNVNKGCVTRVTWGGGKAHTTKRLEI